ncbi:AAA family ATPase [Flavobacterium covae]|uniref:ATP-binding protein n=1 Tax=Flavobacterium covae TaxID=2906076 RepID=UPI0035E43DE3
MKINTLELTNVRGFTYAKLDFQPGFNLIVGINGVGKTTVLESLRIVLSHILTEIKAPLISKESFKKSDNTINSLLALDHSTLIEERRNAIDAFIGKSNPIKKAKTIQAIAEIDKLSNGKYVEFCIPLKHALKEHLVFLEKLEQKLKYARKK